MISLAGVAIYLFGNKKDNIDPMNIILADGLKKEFNIAQDLAVYQIPVKATGYMSGELADNLKSIDFNTDKNSQIFNLMNQLYNETDFEKIISTIILILKQINQ